MDNSVGRQAHQLIQQALELEPHERVSFLRKACDANPQLLPRMDNLIQAVQQSNEFLETEGFSQQALRLPLAPLKAGDQVGNYTVVRMVGMGGMATVYEAIQSQPQRTVALKLPRFDRESSMESHRLRYESEVLGQLQHPAIAQVFEAGTWPLPDGRTTPYFAMEFVPAAQTVVEFAQNSNLALDDRLRLFIQVCYAVQYGHQKGVIHRDLKPPNILITANGNPKVIDFGLARSSSPENRLNLHRPEDREIAGTLNYMSPEQTRSGLIPDVRTDVYSLGVVLTNSLVINSRTILLACRYPMLCALCRKANRPHRERLTIRLQKIWKQSS